MNFLEKIALPSKRYVIEAEILPLMGLRLGVKTSHIVVGIELVLELNYSKRAIIPLLRFSFFLFPQLRWRQQQDQRELARLTHATRPSS